MKKIYNIPIIGYFLKIIVSIIKLPQYIEKTDKNICDIKQAQKKYVEEKNIFFNNGFAEMLENGEKLERLNYALSANPTIWGEKNRIHISPLAAVFTCFFNTNSGNIYVGDYTFAGSNVSILAGSHDMLLKDLPRRDSEIKSGCDIIIGKGVWLASGCTILGPCNIGDNAVIAAGAVVVPGTVVPANTVYAGVPAEMIKELQIDNKIDSNAIIKAVEREQGVLFVEGWTEKRVLKNNLNLTGHWIISKEAKIFTTAKEATFSIYKETQNSLNIIIQYDECSRHITIDQTNTDISILFDKRKRVIEQVEIIIQEECSMGLFVAVKNITI